MVFVSNQELSMFTALICLALVGLVVVSGVTYTRTMNELHWDSAKPTSEAPLN